MIIGVTGMPGSGKTEVSIILKEEGFRTVEMGKVVYEMMDEQGIEITPTSVPTFATALRKEHGKAFVAKEITKRIHGNTYTGKIAIIGIRSPAEIKYFRSKLDKFGIIGIVAPKKIRFERLKKRNRTDDSKKMSNFEFRESKEKGYGVLKAIDAADYIITNTGTRSQLKSDVTHVIASISK